ncbi:MAG: hypothetical protein LBT65_02360 [Synergistaceae bacterium]|jgi:predicted HTH transcriptional regulator|nr:hypothetical protein [Synergistaceae bacterium]
MAFLTSDVGRDNRIESFLAEIGDMDVAFLGVDELDRFPVVCCGMANGDGGWIVLGATREEERTVVRGVADVALLERRLRVSLRDFREISFDPVLSFYLLSSGDKKLLAARAGSAEWWRRPVCVGGNRVRGAYRRVEGVDVISGRDARFRMALDALEPLRDDLPVPGLSVSDLNVANVASFRKKILERRPRWEHLSEAELLKRSLVLDDSGKVTRAGQLLLGGNDSKNDRGGDGENSSPVRVALKAAGAGEEARTFAAPNLWSACEELLPCLCASLSKRCAEAARECFVNALLHAEHDSGHVEVEIDRDARRLLISNPGLSRAGTSERDEAETRNYRLLRILRLVGLARGEGKGLGIVRAFDRMFRMRGDSLELRTVATLSLEISPESVEPNAEDMEETDANAAAQGDSDFWSMEAPPGFDPGWMPVPEKERDRPAVPDFVPLILAIPAETPPEEELDGTTSDEEIPSPNDELPENVLSEEEPPEEEILKEELPEENEPLVSGEPLLSEEPAESFPDAEFSEAELLEEESRKEELPDPVEETPPEEEVPETPLPVEPDVVPEFDEADAGRSLETIEYAPPRVPIFGDAAYELEKYILSLKNVLPARASQAEELGEKAETENKEPEEESGNEEERADAVAAEDGELTDLTGSETGYSPLVSMVRDTPRLPPAVVREAILELCADYRSLPDLSSMLLRSRSSLRRHYLTAMLREGLLEMEFPDRVGHPDQRYRTLQGINEG